METILKTALVGFTIWVAYRIVSAVCYLMTSRKCCACSRDVHPLEDHKTICPDCHNELSK